jgi:hypothetical protein
MSIKSAVQLSLTAPRPGLGVTNVGVSSNALAVTLADLLQGVLEIERHARATEPRNAALLAKLLALKEQAQMAVSEAQGAARLRTTITGGRSGSSGAPGGSAPF